MEALAAIGLAGNIVQFIDFGSKLLGVLEEFRISGNDATRSNQNLELISLEMKRLSSSLAKTITTAPAPDDQKGLIKLAVESETCADELLALLALLKNQDPTSWWQTRRAAIRNIRKQDEKIRLKKNLDNCRKQLSIELGNLASSKTLQKLEDLAASKNVIEKNVSTISDRVQSLRNAFNKAEHLNQEMADNLRIILRSSDQALLRSRQSVFLNALKVEGMHDRFTDVEVAHAKTFEWLIEEPVNTGEDEDGTLSQILDNTGNLLRAQSYPLSEDFRRLANAEFVNWLRYGHGIFHVSGKPGAGKSTLMKFLCRNPKTMEYLKEWSNGKQLIFAQAFFWRLGRKDQKSLHGLLRSLLYQVLSESPELIPKAFPAEWARSESTPAIDFNLKDVIHTFESMMSDTAIFEEHKLMFFIDGLDEYEGPHTEIVDRFLAWTKLHHENIKICVSSREWNEFRVRFQECPKLRLHECTQEDITRVVKDKLHTQREYSTPVNKEDLARLIKEIVRKAEGVFIWVRLVLVAVNEGILDGDDASGLNTRKPDRRKAFESLRMTQFVLGRDWEAPLLRHWVLNLPTPTESQNKEVNLGITQRQIYGRCKGFLEVCQPRFGRSSYEGGDVRFMHSTAHEFLSKPDIKQAIDDVVGHVDFFQRFCQTYLAAVKFRLKDYATYRPLWIGKGFRRDLAMIIEFAANLDQAHWFLDFLGHLEAAFAQAPSNQETFHFEMIRRLPLSVDAGIRFLSINYSLYEFLEKKDSAFLLSIAGGENPENENIDLVCLLFGRSHSRQTWYPTPVDYDRLCRMTEFCFSRGVTPNYILRTLYGGLSMFECFIMIFLFMPRVVTYRGKSLDEDKQCIYPFRLLRLCFQHGARSDLQLGFKPTFPVPTAFTVKIQVARDLVIGTTRNIRIPNFISPRSPIVELARECNWVVTLRDLIVLWFPTDHDTLLSLLDENNRSVSPITDQHSSKELAGSRESNCRDWAEVELGKPMVEDDSDEDEFVNV
ncbi:hypothetical protein F5X99DRAFT_431139 [Biscogniauxia marginata]|nr:hypothetical protein F5X99DRAFT_431139 [Biscogniauxia marginata]